MVAKPTKPSNNMPSSFGGTKENFSASKISNGYEPDVPDILGGANLNYMLDTLGKKEVYHDTICDFINNIPIAKTITVDSSNNLVYKDWLGGRNFGELVYSAIPLSDSGLKLLDGSLLSGSGIYANFVEYIAGLVSTYPSLFVTEQEWQSINSTYGACGKFVYDGTNNTVRIPKITGIIEGTIDVNALGSLVEAGLPQHTHSGTTNSGDKAHTHTRGTMNITGYFAGSGLVNSGNVRANGAIYLNYDQVGGSSDYGGYGGTPGLGLDASRSWTGETSSTSIAHAHTFTSGNASNQTYGKSSKVQPQTTKSFVYMVVATGIMKTDEEIDVDAITTEINTLSADLHDELDNLSTIVSNKVSKSGDTINGTLSLTNTDTHSPSLTFAGIGTGSSSWNAGLIHGYDTNNRMMGAIQFANQDNGNNSIYLTVANPSTGAECVWWGIQVNNNGDVSFSHPQITSTYVNGTSWYRVWSDGWIEQGGHSTGQQNTPFTQNLLKSFSNTNYSVQLIGYSTGNADYNCTVETNSKTASSFQFRRDDTEAGGVDWIACGY